MPNETISPAKSILCNEIPDWPAQTGSALFAPSRAKVGTSLLLSLLTFSA
jgi:hypothetical protein